MYDVWGVDQLPDEMKIIRCEFQIRREVLKQLGAETINDFYDLENNIWKYLSTQWMKFQDRPGTHHNQRETLEWWKKVEEGYQNSQGATPAIRNKAFKIEKIKLAQQVFGILTSLQAHVFEEHDIEDGYTATIEYLTHTFITVFYNNPDKFKDINKEIARKRPRYHRVS
jgi:hypothetical protein